ncbi:aldo/keto reductase [Nesterenkonia flava]|uniref:Aldo/keto reductase n=1 Tax=Nesterenkonia flava TaxID=469799 RepID=A0ABU1FTZ9_9MICC|nr:aldo/keto reductase [Nesterenkonia flava]MDR5712138.1 aldo/keto reductase [Nesterenkonia flava]
MTFPAASDVEFGAEDHALTVTELGYGAMSIAGAYGAIAEQDSQTLLHDLYDRGITFLDTANVYGDGESELRLGEFLKGRRYDVTIATKVGIVKGGGPGKRRARGDAAYIREQIDGSLKRLGTDYVDLYYLHRVDPEVPIEESAGALGELVEAGKVRTIGLSEATAEEIRRAHAVHPVTAVQSEWSVFARDVETHVLGACRELGIGFVAYSPVGRGLITDRFDFDAVAENDVRRTFPWFSSENLPANRQLVQRVGEIGQGAGLSTGATAMAWLYAKARQLGVNLSVIPGTRYIEHWDELATGLEKALDDDAVSALDALAEQVRGDRSFDPNWVSGGREGLLPRA